MNTKIGWVPPEKSPPCMKEPTKDGERILFAAHIQISEADFQEFKRKLESGENLAGLGFIFDVDCFGLDEFTPISGDLREHFIRVVTTWFAKAREHVDPKVKS